jgi:hypothetical protein
MNFVATLLIGIQLELRFFTGTEIYVFVLVASLGASSFSWFVTWVNLIASLLIIIESEFVIAGT